VFPGGGRFMVDRPTHLMPLRAGHPVAPNTRVQRTRSSPSAPRSPLTRHPLGGRRGEMRAPESRLPAQGFSSLAVRRGRQRNGRTRAVRCRYA
jgi:hypothetical protein